MLLVLLLAGIGWQLYGLRDQVESARADRERLAAQVEAKRQENDALAADIAQGSTPEKMEDSPGMTGLVYPDEYVFYDVSN